MPNNLAISADFLSAYAGLPSPQQRGVRSLIARFNNDSTTSGLNYERIKRAKDPNMRSLRINGGYRAIVLKPKRGDVHMLLWADKHDDAYDWAERHRCDINPESGALQVYIPQDDGLAEPSPATAEHTGAFAKLKDRQLMRLGVPKPMLPEVRGIADGDGLESIEKRLPADTYERLFYYREGESYEDLVRERETPQTVDVEDFPTALQRPESQMRFAVATDEELEAMLNAPLEHWRVFLHPSQRRLVERDWNGPVRVLGGAGTGKTVAAMHRARYLARTLPEGRILFTTFTRNLAADIEHNLGTICTPDEMQRIEVTNLDAWVERYLSAQGYPFKLQFGRLPEAWRIALDTRPPSLSLPDAFFEDEWEQVIQAGAVADKQAYLSVSRAGRGTRLNRPQRVLIWPVFEEYRTQLAKRGKKDRYDAYWDATGLLAAAKFARSQDSAGYAAVIVDEAQDMGAPAFRLLRAIAPLDRNDLFITGDGHQRIYGRRRTVLGRCGIDIRGRSHKLRLNYRTTEQTRRWATALLAGRDIDDLDGGLDDSHGIRSLTRGPDPQLAHFDTREEHAAHLLDWVGKLVEAGEPLRGACVVARTRAERDNAAKTLRDGGFESVVLEDKATDDEQRDDAVRVATMHRVKGLEFHHVLLASVNSGLVPLRARGEPADAMAKENAETEERALLHVAATRARKSLTVLSFGRPSRFVVST